MVHYKPILFVTCFLFSGAHAITEEVLQNKLNYVGGFMKAVNGTLDEHEAEIYRLKKQIARLKKRIDFLTDQYKNVPELKESTT